MGPGAAANIYFLTSAAPSKAMIALKDLEALGAYHSTLKQEGKVEFVDELQDKESIDSSPFEMRMGMNWYSSASLTRRSRGGFRSNCNVV